MSRVASALRRIPVVEQRKTKSPPPATVFGAPRIPAARGRSPYVRAHVFDFVDEKKAEGWPPEQVIVAVKRIADDVGLRASPGVIYKREAWRPSDALLIDMVKWCVERYFGQVPAETEAK